MRSDVSLCIEDFLLLQGVFDIWLHVIYFLLAIFAELERNHRQLRTLPRHRTYSSIRLSALHFSEGAKIFGKLTTVTGELRWRTSHTLAAFRQFSSFRVEEEPLTEIIKLLLREFGVHEMSTALCTFDPGLPVSGGVRGKKSDGKATNLSGKVTAFNLGSEVVSVRR